MVAMRMFFPGDGELDEQLERLGDIAEKGKEAMKSNISQAVLDVFPDIDTFISLVDDFVKVR